LCGFQGMHPLTQTLIYSTRLMEEKHSSYGARR
jgi:hypothetical protein